MVLCITDEWKNCVMHGQLTWCLNLHAEVLEVLVLTVEDRGTRHQIALTRKVFKPARFHVGSSSATMSLRLQFRLLPVIGHVLSNFVCSHSLLWYFVFVLVGCSTQGSTPTFFLYFWKLCHMNIIIFLSLLISITSFL